MSRCHCSRLQRDKMLLTNTSAFLLLLLIQPSRAASYSDRTPQTYFIDDRHLPSNLVMCESSNDCSYDNQQEKQQEDEDQKQQQQQPLRAWDDERCKDDGSCLLQDGSVDLVENGLNAKVVHRRPFEADTRSLKKTHSPPTEDDVPAHSLKHAVVDYCRFVCFVMTKTKPEVRMNTCITQYCATKGMDRLPSLEKRWGNRVGRWSKRWGNRVCLEAHCRPFENNVRAFLACGQSQCHGK